MKFFVVAVTFPDLYFFLINSDPSPFALSKPTLARTQVKVLQVEHPAFLLYDSWLDCAIVKRDYTGTQLQTMLAADASLFKGVMSQPARASVRAAVEGNKLLPKELIQPLRNVWP